jgi:hypothetical protein
MSTVLRRHVAGSVVEPKLLFSVPATGFHKVLAPELAPATDSACE